MRLLNLIFRHLQHNIRWMHAHRSRCHLAYSTLCAGLLFVLLAPALPAQEGVVGKLLNLLPQGSNAPTESDANELPPATPLPAPTLDALLGNGAEDIPPQQDRLVIPFAGGEAYGDVSLKANGNKLTLISRDAPLSQVLALLAKQRGLNIVAASGVDSTLSIALYDKTVEEVLRAILTINNFTYHEQDGIIYVTSVAAGPTLPAEIQGRQIQVFKLDFVDALSMSTAVQGFLSPAGSVFVHESSPTDNRRTQESIVVEDIPAVMNRVATFIHQMDQAPRQVLIEAQILQVDLQDNRNHGVNWEEILSAASSDITFRTAGFASRLASPASFIEIDGDDVNVLIEMIKSTTDAKTLASPKLMVVNEQTARIQVGEQLGFRVTTTTETSTLESVEFLDVGVVLEITPRITRDNRVLLRVRPEVSSGQVNPNTGLPEEETTELSTDVMVDDGYGMVIGGLIQESDSVIQNKVPYLGDAWLIGKLFQRQEVKKDRSEIIVALIPRVLPYGCDYASYEQGELVRTGTKLFEGPLLRKSRPWYPKLPDAISNPRIIRLPPVGKTYPWPASPVENAATPQPQEDLPVPTYPPPGLRMHPAQLPNREGPPFEVAPDMWPGGGNVEVLPDETVERLPVAPFPAQ